MMTPEKRERYAQWLRNTGVEHPSDELINKTQKLALGQINTAKEEKRRFNVKVVVLVVLSMIVVVCLWLRL